MSEHFFDEIDADESEASPASLAYIKVIGLAEARALGTVIPSDIELLPNVKLYALHSADGTAIAVTDNRAIAFGAAVMNNFLPMSVH